MRSMRSSLQRAAMAAASAYGVSASPLAFATAQRTFVSSTGSDAHSCSLAQPCRSFAAAITQTLAGGEVIVLDSAGYGPVTIGKSVSIVAPPGIHAGISVFSGDAITVNAPNEVVVLRGLSINGQGGTHGINVQGAARLRIENRVISGLAQDDVHDAALHGELVVVDSVARDNGNFGLNVTVDGSVLDHVRSEHNDAGGLHVGPSGVTVDATVIDSAFVHNGARGIVAESHVANANVTLAVERTNVSSNVGSGLLVSVSQGSASAAFAHNTVNHNGDDGFRLEGGALEPAVAMITANTILANQIGIHVVNSAAYASANTVNSAGLDLFCEGGGNLNRRGDNNALTAAGCGATIPGI